MIDDWYLLAILTVKSEVRNNEGCVLCLHLPTQVDGRRLAILCQKVENLVVGAPCGIMDQVRAACRSGQKSAH